LDRKILAGAIEVSAGSGAQGYAARDFRESFNLTERELFQELKSLEREEKRIRPVVVEYTGLQVSQDLNRKIAFRLDLLRQAIRHRR
jgi:hypothetical protein